MKCSMVVAMLQRIAIAIVTLILNFKPQLQKIDNIIILAIVCVCRVVETVKEDAIIIILIKKIA